MLPVAVIYGLFEFIRQSDPVDAARADGHDLRRLGHQHSGQHLQLDERAAARDRRDAGPRRRPRHRDVDHPARSRRCWPSAAACSAGWPGTRCALLASPWIEDSDRRHASASSPWSRRSTWAICWALSGAAGPSDAAGAGAAFRRSSLLAIARRPLARRRPPIGRTWPSRWGSSPLRGMWDGRRQPRSHSQRRTVDRHASYAYQRSADATFRRSAASLRCFATQPSIAPLSAEIHHEIRHEPAALDRRAERRDDPRPARCSRTWATTASSCRSSTRRSTTPSGARCSTTSAWRARPSPSARADDNPISPDAGVRQKGIEGEQARARLLCGGRRDDARRAVSTRPSATSAARAAPTTNGSGASRACGPSPSTPARSTSRWASNASTASRPTCSTRTPTRPASAARSAIRAAA